jgi:glycosyltransferase involved in cell wall biosynthesis
VIPNGAEKGLFPAPHKAGCADAGDLATAVYSGNMVPYQGVDLLQDAFARAACQRPGIRLRILTDGSFAPYESPSRLLGIRDNIEVRRSNLAQLPGELSNAAVAVNPRIACDGLPQKLLNDMAAGRPIVSCAGSARHLVHERNALIVVDGDCGALSAAILHLLGDRQLARELGGNARKKVRSLMTWQHTAVGIEQVDERVTRGVDRDRCATRNSERLR